MNSAKAFFIAEMTPLNLIITQSHTILRIPKLPFYFWNLVTQHYITVKHSGLPVIASLITPTVDRQNQSEKNKPAMMINVTPCYNRFVIVHVTGFPCYPDKKNNERVVWNFLKPHQRFIYFCTVWAVKQSIPDYSIPFLKKFSA